MELINSTMINREVPKWNGEHFWVIALFHKADLKALGTIFTASGRTLIATHGPACFFCGNTYKEGMEFTPCGGESDF